MRLHSFFHRKKSSDIARDRLKILLISDRVNCSPEMMDMIKNDIAKVISKYMKIDDESMEVQITKKGNSKKGMKSPFLYVNIPIIDLKGQKYVFTEWNDLKNIVIKKHSDEII